MGYKITPVDRWIINPVNSFISQSSTGGIVLIISAAVAIFMANSPWADWYHDIWEYKILLGLDENLRLDKSLHHWINDGLMAVFFFVIGLELKREIVAGELSTPKNAILPIFAGIGGMVFPALIYTCFNGNSTTAAGWGIPMATDLAFALAVLHLLGKRVPASLKIFLTAFAIVDDLGSVLVIAMFYTADISVVNLLVGLGFLVVLGISNIIGVRNIFYYALLGIGGVWLFFLLSGVHATIAAILVAFTIPATTKINEFHFIKRMNAYLEKFKNADPNDKPTLTPEQLHILDDMGTLTRKAMTPLQKLEHDMHPVVAFIIMPVFALANAGVSMGGNLLEEVTGNVAMGVAIGLLVGKMIGIFGVSALLLKLRLVPMPRGVTYKHLFGLGLVSAIGFTMSLFINELAFGPMGQEGHQYISQAKIGIIIASLVGGISGFLLLRTTRTSPPETDL